MKYGFKRVGVWQRDSNDLKKIVPIITSFENERVIYAFVENSLVRYIGIVKSSKRTFKQRLGEYRSPYTNGKGSTNKEIGIRIIELLEKGIDVQIIALKPNYDSEISSYNGLEVDLVTGLESSLIDKFNLTNTEKGWNKSS
ncbi:MAG: hypothetical protein M1129_04395 [Candidatus Thermoplasmatota archaeon]|nr:hypothetical protein [Candidatus Thermoplasmatota archaeon]MCL5955437.1 hypothetical protein [Candidatus Thermoplasmatota archaeon]